MKALLSLAASLAFTVGALAAEKQPVNAGPYVPSPTSVVADMLTLAQVSASDYVVDLGSGDGRIVLTAAKVFGARGFGVDINPKLVKEANEAAKAQGIADRASFHVQDLFKTDISKATVVTMYLLPDTVQMLRDKLLTELRPGARILSHDYGLNGWMPEKSITMDLEDKVAISGVTTTILYLYMVPAKIDGRWSASLPPALGRTPVPIEFSTQRVTRVMGRASLGGKEAIVEDGAMHGETLTFRLIANAKPYDFTGKVKDGRIEGTVSGGGTTAPWSAVPAK
ncbi:MAG TPA: class I SAM-dependent methyltransferase [Burkholderiales bacterium]|jgi:hypothetical protein|nr:class I SAM-dependent methyltransferase [Burkholderiales bacterium]